MLERIERIDEFVAGLDENAFAGDQKTVDSVVRNLQVIGEAAARLPKEFRSQHSEIPWRRIVGLRNRIVHEYFDVDLAIVWGIVRTELPGLKSQVQSLLRGPRDSTR